MNQAILPKVMYISLDGMMEPLGHSQVLKYLEKLSSHYEITLISFEKSYDLINTNALEILVNECTRHDIQWIKLKYRTGYFGVGQIINILSLISVPFYVLMKKNIKIIHIRSYMPGIAIPLLSIFFKFKLIFDMRGFWADEKHDRAGWEKESFKYKFFKKLESYLISRADSIVTLTNIAKETMRDLFKVKHSKIHVIPTCVDSEEFRRINYQKNPDKIIVGYLGSVDTAYDFNKFLFLIEQMHDELPQTVSLRVFTEKNKAFIKNLLLQNHLESIDLDVKFINRNQLPEEISKIDFLGFCLKENFSIQASMPTKIAEALACGVPIVCNAFNEDIKKLILHERIGLIYDFQNKLTDQNFESLLNITQDPLIHERCSDIAINLFSLENGVSKYRSIYKQLDK